MTGTPESIRLDSSMEQTPLERAIARHEDVFRRKYSNNPEAAEYVIGCMRSVLTADFASIERLREMAAQNAARTTGV